MKVKRHLQTIIVSLCILCTISKSLTAQTWPTSTKVFEPGIGIIHLVPIDDEKSWVYGMGVNSANEFTENNLSLSKSSDAGKTWQPITFPKPTAGYLSNLCAVNKDVAWVAYNQYDDQTKSGVVLLKTIDGGTTWKQQSIGMSIWINAVHFFDLNHGLAIGDPNDKGFEIYTTSNGGDTWTAVAYTNIPDALPDEFGSSDVFSVTGDKFVFPTTEHRLVASTDRGKSWKLIELPKGEILNFENYIYDSNGNGYAIYGGISKGKDAFALYRTPDNGSTWKNITLADKFWWILDVAKIPNTPTLIGTFANLNTKPARQQTRVSHNQGDTWQTIDTSTFIWNTNFASPSTGFGFSRVWAKHNEVHKYAGSALTGIFDPKHIEAALSFYPNPTASEAIVTIKSPKIGDYVLLINDLQGRLVYKKYIDQVNDHQELLTLSHLSSGMYVLTLSNKEGLASLKFTKE
jgi:photosystem II stability/assembly factor-like uncharacterized protein